MFIEKIISVNPMIFFTFISGHAMDIQPLVFLYLAFSAFNNFLMGQPFWPFYNIYRRIQIQLLLSAKSARKISWPLERFSSTLFSNDDNVDGNISYLYMLLIDLENSHLIEGSICEKVETRFHNGIACGCACLSNWQYIYIYIYKKSTSHKSDVTDALYFLATIYSVRCCQKRFLSM